MIIVKYSRNGKVYDWLQCKDRESLDKWISSLGSDIKIISITF